MKFLGIIKASFVDYPGKIVTTLFTAGCNFRCEYCHNPELINYSDSNIKIGEDEVIDVLLKKWKNIDGVCITGGEPLLWIDDLTSFIKNIRDRFGESFLIKIDTNGSMPDRLNKIIKDVDFVAIDFKGMRYEKFSTIDNLCFKKSFNIIRNSKVDYEVRITMYPDYILESDFEDIAKNLEKSKKIVIQQFNPDKVYVEKKIQPYNEEVLKKLGEKLKKNSIVEYR